MDTGNKRNLTYKSREQDFFLSSYYVSLETELSCYVVLCTSQESGIQVITVGSFFFSSFCTEVLYEGMQFKDSLEMDQPGGTWAETCSTTSTQSVESAAVPVSGNSMNPFNLSKKAFIFYGIACLIVSKTWVKVL